MKDDGKSITSSKRVVVKIGSNALTGDHGLNLKVIGSISRQISLLMDKGIEVIFVSPVEIAGSIQYAFNIEKIRAIEMYLLKSSLFMKTKRRRNAIIKT